MHTTQTTTTNANATSDANAMPYDIAVERAVDATLRRATYGALAGGVAALTLLRGPRARAACLAFGVGCGVGSAYEESQRAFANVR